MPRKRTNATNNAPASAGSQSNEQTLRVPLRPVGLVDRAAPSGSPTPPIDLPDASVGAASQHAAPVPANFAVYARIFAAANTTAGLAGPAARSPPRGQRGPAGRSVAGLTSRRPITAAARPGRLRLGRSWALGVSEGPAREDNRHQSRVRGPNTRRQRHASRPESAASPPCAR